MEHDIDFSKDKIRELICKDPIKRLIDIIAELQYATPLSEEYLDLISQFKIIITNDSYRSIYEVLTNFDKDSILFSNINHVHIYLVRNSALYKDLYDQIVRNPFNKKSLRVNMDDELGIYKRIW